jgi:iron complex outermembrane receptor protein
MYRNRFNYRVFHKGRAAAMACWLSVATGVNAVDTDVNLEDLTELSLEELMDIQITSVFKRPVKLSESPSAIQVITRDQIRRSGVTTIPEALRLATNLNVAQQNTEEWIISARGFSSDVGNKLLVMIDGRSIYTPLFSGVFWSRHNYLLEDIDRIEVISGPGGALWGANAVNGVINIITRSAADTQGLYVEAAAGTETEAVIGLRYGGKMNEASDYRIYTKFLQRGPENLSNGDDGNLDWNIAQGGFRVDSQLTSRDHLTVQGDYFRKRTDILVSGIFVDDRSESEGHNILARWNRDYDGGDISLQFYYDYTELKLPTPPFVFNGIPLAPAGILNDKLDTYDIAFQHSLYSGMRHRVLWGLNYRRTNDETDNAPGLAFYPEQLNQNLASAFIQDEIEFLDEAVKLTLGAKLERNSYTGNEWQPNIRLSWNLSGSHMVWGAVSRAVRMPSRIDRDVSQPSQSSVLVILAGGDEFESERVTAYEIGYRTQVDDALVGSISTFFNQYEDIRSASLTPNTVLPVFFENNVEGNTYGVEININYQAAAWWQLRGGYTFLEESLRVKAGAFDLNNALNETADPKHQVFLRSSLELSQNVELDVGLRWIDELPTNNNGTAVYVPSYAELDLRLGWRPSETLELSLVGQNLLHDHHHEFGVPSPIQEEVGRNVLAKLVWRY